LPLLPINTLTQNFSTLFKGRSSIVFWALLILSLLIFILPVRTKKGFTEIALSFSYGPFYSLANRIEELHQVNQKNRVLGELVMKLSLKNYQLEEERIENMRLKELLQFKQKSSFELIPTKVISIEPGRFPISLLINLGEKDGLKKGMPVININGLVGKISEVLVGSSVVQLLFHPNCRVSALDKRSRVQGIVKSKGGIILDLGNVPLEEDIKTGDEIFTSGLGGIFPPNLRIGRVISVRQNSDSAFKTIKLKPAVNFFQLEELFIIKSY